MAELALWLLFMVAGLLPARTYFELRRAGDVMTSDAMINSPWLIYYAAVAFMTWFAYQATSRIESAAERRGRAFTVSAFAMIGFLPIRLDEIPRYIEVFDPTLRNVALLALGVKCLSWLYLLWLLTRYYLVDPGAFERVTPILPSVIAEQRGGTKGRTSRNDSPRLNAVHFARHSRAILDFIEIAILG